jgi:hypothetical protein
MVGRPFAPFVVKLVSNGSQADHFNHQPPLICPHKFIMLLLTFLVDLLPRGEPF